MSQPSVTKAIIPTAGYGTRRLPITKAIDKTMLPIGNRPLVDYVVQDVIAAGVTDIYIVVSDLATSQIRKYYTENYALDAYLREHNKDITLTQTVPAGVNIHCIEQGYSDKYGSALPVAAAVEQAELDESALVLMGDDFIWNPDGPTASQSLLAAAESETDSTILGIEIPLDQVSRYGVIREEQGEFAGIVEKPSPAEAPSNLINVSKYLMSAALLHEVVDYVHAHDFGPGDQEYMITDPINSYIARGGVMRVASTTGQFLDGGSLEGWLHANNVVCG